MGNFKRFSGGGERGGGRFNKGGFGGGNRRDGGRPEMFRATCADCGNSCEVPFRPTGERPVYCSDCFGKNRGGSDRGGERRDFSPRAPQAMPHDARIDDLKRQMEFVQSKLDKIIGMLEMTMKKPMATPDFYEKVEKIGTEIKTKKASAKKEKAASKKKK